MIGMTTLFAMLAGVLGGNARPTRDYAKRRPVGFQLRNPADPVQAARIEAAQVKRQRKAEKRVQSANNHWNRNYCHHDGFRKLVGGPLQAIAPASLNPFYVAK